MNYLWEDKIMKKLILTLLLACSMSVLSAMTWARYEIMCYFNGKEPIYEEYVWLCSYGATDFGYDNDDLILLLSETENTDLEEEIE